MGIIPRHLKLVGAAALVALTSLVFQGCFTGIEHTGQITLSKKDRAISHKISKEEEFMLDIKGEAAAQWQQGREFLVVGDRAVLVFENPLNDPTGKLLMYHGHSERLTPAGSTRIILHFVDSAGTDYRYVTNKENIQSVISSELPMLIDMAQVNSLRDKLAGKHLWIKTDKWLKSTGEIQYGCKYDAVTITDVCGGIENLPFLIYFTDSSGQQSCIRMSQSEGALASRPFHTLFSLEDPRLSYPSVSDEIWNKIKHGQVAEGMTKQECRLALGNPDNIDTGRDYSRVIESWTYANGIFLRFEDGILVYFRK